MMQLAGFRISSRRVFYRLLMLWALALPLMALAAGGDDYAERFAKAQSLVQQGDDAGASKIYQALIKQDPSQPQAYNNLAAIKARHGELKQAQALLEQALRSNPVYAAVYDNLSAIYVEMARDSYGKALHLETPQQAIALHEIDGPKPTASASTQIAALPANKTPVPSTTTLASAGKTTAESVNKPQSNPTSIVVPVSKPQSAPAATSQVATPAATHPAPVAVATSSDANTASPAAVEKPVVTKPVATPTPATETKALLPAAGGQADQASEPASNNSEELVTTLQGWAAAWSGQAVDLYLSFYTNDYAPVGMTHAQWQAQRRQRLLAPKWIRVSLSDVQVKLIKADEADVRLIQHYQADNYQDRTRKALRLRRGADGWKIIEETTVATLR